MLLHFYCLSSFENSLKRRKWRIIEFSDPLNCLSSVYLDAALSGLISKPISRKGSCRKSPDLRNRRKLVRYVRKIVWFEHNLICLKKSGFSVKYIPGAYGISAKTYENSSIGNIIIDRKDYSIISHVFSVTGKMVNKVTPSTGHRQRRVSQSKKHFGRRCPVIISPGAKTTTSTRRFSGRCRQFLRQNSQPETLPQKLQCLG